LKIFSLSKKYENLVKNFPEFSLLGLGFGNFPFQEQENINSRKYENLEKNFSLSR
jgi:hypothetical protein